MVIDDLMKSWNLYEDLDTLRFWIRALGPSYDYWGEGVVTYKSLEVMTLNGDMCMEP